MQAMRMATDDLVIREFLMKYDSLSSDDQKRVPWEAIVIAAKLDFRVFTGSVIFALQNWSVNAVKIVALSAHPEVMQKTAEYALLPSGEKDRQTIHQGLGFIKSPQGPTFIGKQVIGGSSSRTDEDDDDAGKLEGPTVGFGADDDLDKIFPPANLIQDKLIHLRQKMLPEKSASTTE